jgi:uncharacterized RDD family membrane protein YckC
MADQWYVGRNGQKAGPYSTEQLKRMAAAGQLVPTDLLWKQGLETWVPLEKVKGLIPAAAGGTLPPLDLESQGAAPAGAFDFRAAPAARPDGPAEWNPYQASSTSDLTSGGGQGIVYAEFMPRVAASLLDGIFIGLIGTVCQLGVIAFFGVVSGGDGAMLAIGNLLGVLLNVAIQLLYFVGYETSAKQGTWGKQILGIKVTNMEGGRLTTGQAIGRFFAKFITGLTCSIGYLLPLFTDRKQTLHDLICGCLALKK